MNKESSKEVSLLKRQEKKTNGKAGDAESVEAAAVQVNAETLEIWERRLRRMESMGGNMVAVGRILELKKCIHDLTQANRQPSSVSPNVAGASEEEKRSL